MIQEKMGKPGKLPINWEGFFPVRKIIPGKNYNEVCTNCSSCTFLLKINSTLKKKCQSLINSRGNSHIFSYFHTIITCSLISQLQGCYGTGKTGNLDVSFFQTENTGNLPPKEEKNLSLEIKGCT